MKFSEHRHYGIQTQVMNPDLIIEGGTAITMVEGEEPITDARIFVEDGRIAYVGRLEETVKGSDLQAELIDARNSIIMPGLINSHAHTAMTLFRGFADDLPLNRWLFEKIFPAEAKFLNPETVYCGSLLGLSLIHI